MKEFGWKFKRKLIKVSSMRLLVPALVKFIRIIAISTSKKKVITSLSQHLGDNIAAEPLDAFIRKRHSDQYIIRIVGKSFSTVVNSNPNINCVIEIDCLSEWIYLKPMLSLFFKVYDYHVHKSFCLKYRLVLSNPNRFGIDVSNYFGCGNLLEVFCKNCDIESFEKRPTVYFPSNFISSVSPEGLVAVVVIHANSNNAKKDWSNRCWLDLIDFFASRKFIVIEVGLSSNLDCESPSYKNYCGKLSLNEIAFVISKCSFFVGIDSAFAHFANAFNVPRLILLGHFNQFTNYIPYSGMSDEEEARTIIHHNGPVKELPFEVVRDKIAAQLLK